MIIGMQELALLIGILTQEPALTLSPPDLACLARNIYHEARGESDVGMTSVGYVTTKRLRSGRWGSTLCEVVEAPSQFSWHSDGKPDAPMDLEAYRAALHAAVTVLLERAPDASNRATHYFAHDLTLPAWAARLTPTARVGGHTFMTTCESHKAAPECAPLPIPKPGAKA